MIITKTVKYYGKEVPVEKLTNGSAKKVLVECPKCGNKRYVEYNRLVRTGHHYCLPCIRKIAQKKTLPVGSRYGRLTVIGESEKKSKSLCRCDCGKVVDVYNYSLKNGKTKSCGCLKKNNFKNSPILSGEKHWNWKGGISNIREREMQSVEYKNWRGAVFERDSYICQKCGQVGYELNAHHINDYKNNKKKRLDIHNGITLCKKCHIEFHSEYGRKNNKKQMDEYLNKGEKDEITVSHKA